MAIRERSRRSEYGRSTEERVIQAGDKATKVAQANAIKNRHPYVKTGGVIRSVVS
jgi:hypothetical protein